MSSVGTDEQTQDDPFWRGYRMVNGVRIPLSEEDLLHPLEGDEIVQNDPHRRDVMYLFSVLETVLGEREGLLVLGDHRVDWGHATIEPHAPDVVVFENAQRWDRRQVETFPAGVVGARPILIIEVTSPSTRNNDLIHKLEEYRVLGIQYYLIIDRLAGRRHDQVQLLARRRSRSRWQTVPLGELGRVNLPGMRVAVGVEDGVAVCYDVAGEPFPVYSAAMRRIEEEVAARDEALRQLAAADAARIRAEQARIRAEGAQASAEGAQARAEEENRTMREEMARMRAELEALRGR